jgi:hypothetical protein
MVFKVKSYLDCCVKTALCFCSVHLCSQWQIQLIADCPLVNAARPPGLPLLCCYYGVQGGTLHVEYICGGMDTVALVGPDLRALPRAICARGRELSMFIMLIW